MDTYVAEIGVGRVNLGTKFLIERHPPESVVFMFSGNVEFFP